MHSVLLFVKIRPLNVFAAADISDIINFRAIIRIWELFITRFNVLKINVLNTLRNEMSSDFVGDESKRYTETEDGFTVLRQTTSIEHEYNKRKTAAHEFISHLPTQSNNLI